MISLVWCHLTKLLCHLTCVSSFIVFLFTQSNLWQNMNLFCLVAGALTWTFQFDLHFRSKILANLTANWKTRGMTKPDHKIINTINHYGN